MAFMTPEYWHGLAYRFDGPEGWRPFFAATPGDKLDADKLAEWLEFDAPAWFADLMGEPESNVWSVERDESPMWYVRLSASGYMDATEWSGPHETEAEAQAYLRDSHDVDPATGEPLSEGQAYRYVFDKLSGTGFIERTSDGLTTPRFVGEQAQELCDYDGEELASLVDGDSLEFS